MNIGPWFDSLPEPIKILLLLISGLTGLCTAGATLLRQWSYLRRMWLDTAAPSEEEAREE